MSGTKKIEEGPVKETKTSKAAWADGHPLDDIHYLQAKLT
jgi:hypothetical protein